MERKLSPIHIVALAVTSLIFLVGILFGWQLGYTAENQMRDDFEQLRTESYTLEVLSLMMNRGEMSCSVLEKEFSKLSRNTIQYGENLDYLEKKLGKFDPEVMRLKSDYSLMQARNYLLLKEMDEGCGSEHVTVLYFYSNENYSPSSDQGIALDEALNSLPEVMKRTVIYHFDVNVRNSVVDAFKEQYSVSVSPTMVIDGGKHEGYRSSEECRKILEEIS